MTTYEKITKDIKKIIKKEDYLEDFYKNDERTIVLEGADSQKMSLIFNAKGELIFWEQRKRVLVTREGAGPQIINTNNRNLVLQFIFNYVIL